MKTVKKMYGTYMYERYLFAKEKDHFTRKLKRVNKQLEISGTFILKYVLYNIRRETKVLHKLNKAQRTCGDDVLDLKLRETFSASNDDNIVECSSARFDANDVIVRQVASVNGANCP